MNVTELARKLKINTSELLEILPEFGFDIGKKAIKVDEKVARKILEAGSDIRIKLEENKKAKLEELQKLSQTEKKEGISQEVSIPPIITVRDFASIINKPVNVVIKELMKNGVLASLNERIDFETAAIIADEFGLKLTLAEESEWDKEHHHKKIKEILEEEKREDLKPRPPVIVVMGHVDHGKTKLLDTIRKTNVIDSEAGGITQHIGAYQAKRKDRILTFIDTPGHEAFTAMRSRGAKIADIAILVIAANDSIKPQTVEAIKIIQQSQIPMVVAINKIDLPDANIEKVKQDLAGMNLLPEDWGGKTIAVPISAKANIGIDDLLDTVLLVAEMEKEKIMANPNKEALGTVIESHVDKGQGPVATVLVQNGTLKLGDSLCIDNNFLGKARGLKDYSAKELKIAGPSVPVEIIGLKYAPKVGDIVEVVNKIERKHKKAKIFDSQRDAKPAISVFSGEDSPDAENVKLFNLIIKADVLGSLEAIIESLEKIDSSEVKVKIVSKGLGNITDTDVSLAESTGALLVGFNVKAIPLAENLAKEKNIEIKYYNIIYKLLEDMKAIMSELLSPEIVRTDLGKLQVLEIFKTENNTMIIGARVLEGKVVKGAKAEVWRKKELITSGEISELQSAKQIVSEVVADQECGISFSGKPLIEKGDKLIIYQEDRFVKKL